MFVNFSRITDFFFQAMNLFASFLLDAIATINGHLVVCWVDFPFEEGIFSNGSVEFQCDIVLSKKLFTQ